MSDPITTGDGRRPGWLFEQRQRSYERHIDPGFITLPEPGKEVQVLVLDEVCGGCGGHGVCAQPRYQRFYLCALCDGKGVRLTDAGLSILRLVQDHLGGPS